MGNLRKRQQMLQRLLDNMAAITLEALAHSYLKKPKVDADYALKKIDYEWQDGGAYALLGPSGCCLLYTSPSPRDQRGSRMPSSA